MARIIIYTTNYCPYCHRALDFLKKNKLDFENIDVTNDPATRKKLADENDGYRTVPMIFIDGVFIGGCDDLLAMKL